MPRRTWLPAAALLALTGCGATKVNIPTFPTFPSPPTEGGAATFHLDGQTISLQQSGRGTVRTGFRGIDHDGPIGCRGHYFIGHITEHIDFEFHYGKRGAWLLIGTSRLFHFTHAPRRHGGALIYAQTFGGQRQSAVIRCPRRSSVARGG